MVFSTFPLAAYSYLSGTVQWVELVEEARGTGGRRADSGNEVNDATDNDWNGNQNELRLYQLGPGAILYTILKQKDGRKINHKLCQKIGTESSN